METHQEKKKIPNVLIDIRPLGSVSVDLHIFFAILVEFWYRDVMDRYPKDWTVDLPVVLPKLGKG